MSSPIASPSEKGALQSFQRARSRWQESSRIRKNLSPMPQTELKSPDSLLLKTAPKTIKLPELAVEKKLFQEEEEVPEKNPFHGKVPSDNKPTSLTDSSDAHRDRLIAFYGKYNPSKLDSVDATLLKYQGNEEEMFRRLEQKYNSGAFPPPGGTGPTCYLIFQEQGRVEIQLFADKTPLACENFRALCTGELGKGYSNSVIHRIVPNFCIQGGDFTKGDGTGGESIFLPNSEHGDMWGKFKDELFMKHNQKGLLSMANNGKDRNGSQFFITLAPLPQLDGKHVVFGQVTKGMDVVEMISEMQTDKKQRPLEGVIISGCGEVRNGLDFSAESTKVSQGSMSFSFGAASSATPFSSKDSNAPSLSFSASTGKPFSLGGSGGMKPFSLVAQSAASPVHTTYSFENTRPSTEFFINSKHTTEKALNLSGLSLKPDEGMSGSLLSLRGNSDDEFEDTTDPDSSTSTQSDTSQSENDDLVELTKEPERVSASASRKVVVATSRQKEDDDTKVTAYKNPFVGIDFAKKVQADPNPFSEFAVCKPITEVDDSTSATEKPAQQPFSFGQPSVSPKSSAPNR